MGLLKYYSSLNSGLGVQPANVYTGNSFTVDGPTYTLAAQPIVGTTWNPSVLYHDGNTYVVTKENQVSSNGLAIIIKYNGTSIQTVKIPDAVALVKDYHDYPTISIDNNGFILVVLEQHTTNPRIYKSDNPEDISTWTKLTLSGSLAASNDYNKVAYINGIGHINISRDRTGGYGLYFKKSVDGATWTDGLRITSALTESGSTDWRHYPQIPVNWIQNDFIHVGLYKRVTIAAVDLYIRLWKMKTPNNPSTIGKVWYNEQETFSRDVDASGQITEAELNANFLVWYDSSLTNENQDFYSIWHNRFKYKQAFTSAANAWFEYSGGWRETTSDAEILLDMSLTDLFTIKKVGDLKLSKLDSNNNSIVSGEVALTVDTGGGLSGLVKAPMNLSNIPSGSTFVIALNAYKGDTNPITGTFSNDLVMFEMIKH